MADFDPRYLKLKADLDVALNTRLMANVCYAACVGGTQLSSRYEKQAKEAEEQVTRARERLNGYLDHKINAQ